MLRGTEDPEDADHGGQLLVQRCDNRVVGHVGPQAPVVPTLWRVKEGIKLELEAAKLRGGASETNQNAKPERCHFLYQPKRDVANRPQFCATLSAHCFYRRILIFIIVILSICHLITDQLSLIIPLRPAW